MCYINKLALPCLHRRLVDSISVASVGSSASRCRSCHMKKFGLRLNAKKSVLSPLQRTTFLGVIWDSTSTADMWYATTGAPVTGTYRVHPVGCGKNKARPVTHCQTLTETIRSYGSSLQRDTFWTLHCCTWDPCSGGSGPKGFPRGATPFAWSRSRSDAFVPW